VEDSRSRRSRRRHRRAPAQATLDAPDQRVGFAIVGIGDFATNQIIPSIPETKMCRLAGFVTGDPNKGREFARRFGVKESSVYTYDQMARMADNPEIEVAYIITPNALHRAHTVAAAKAGKHVLCEKPMATKVDDCRAMIAACRDAGRRLMIAYRAQYEPYNLTAVRLCRSGELGKIVSVTSDHGRILKPEEPQDRWRADKELSGGGSLPDIGIYSLQAARYLTGEEPIEITALLEQPEDDPRFGRWRRRSTGRCASRPARSPTARRRTTGRVSSGHRSSAARRR
jgi:predicted dehydrogenase